MKYFQRKLPPRQPNKPAISAPLPLDKPPRNVQSPCREIPRKKIIPVFKSQFVSRPPGGAASGPQQRRLVPTFQPIKAQTMARQNGNQAVTTTMSSSGFESTTSNTDVESARGGCPSFAAQVKPKPIFAQRFQQTSGQAARNPSGSSTATLAGNITAPSSGQSHSQTSTMNKRKVAVRLIQHNTVKYT